MKYDLVATTGKYQKDGETKYLTKNVGKMIEVNGRQKILLDASFNPAGCEKTEDGKVWIALFEQRDNNKQPASGKPQVTQEAFDSDIPF
jgi:single-strand DNA-binding protein